MNKLFQISCLLLVCFAPLNAKTAVQSGKYKIVRQAQQDNTIGYIDSFGNYVAVTRYGGEEFGVIVKCLLLDGLQENELIKKKTIDLIKSFVPPLLQKELLSSISGSDLKSDNDDFLRIDVKGDYSECFIQINWLPEAISITIKSVK